MSFFESFSSAGKKLSDYTVDFDRPMMTSPDKMGSVSVQNLVLRSKNRFRVPKILFIHVLSWISSALEFFKSFNFLQKLRKMEKMDQKRHIKPMYAKQKRSIYWMIIPRYNPVIKKRISKTINTCSKFCLKFFEGEVMIGDFFDFAVICELTVLVEKCASKSQNGSKSSQSYV